MASEPASSERCAGLHKARHRAQLIALPRPKISQHSSARKPLRISLEVGENDLGAKDAESGHHNWVMANQRTAAALKAKGYHYRFLFVKGAGHCDSAAIRATLPDTLEFMWRDYRP